MKPLKSLLLACALGSVALTLLGTLGVAYWWTTQQYQPTEPRRVALEFAGLLADRAQAPGNLEKAHALTQKSTAVGANFADFEAKVIRNGCGGKAGGQSTVAYTFPRQTNGNRLRRVLTGREVDYGTVSVEIGGGCPFEVRMERSPNGRWLVSYFQSHAS